MTGTADDRVRDMLSEAWKLLDRGHNRESADIFGRIRLRDPSCPEARRGLEKARAAAAEAERALDARLDEARRLMDSGDRRGAQGLLEGLLTQGVDRERLLTLLDRADGRGGRVRHPAPPPDSTFPPAPTPRPRPAWSRRALVAAWAVTFALLAGGVASSWERIVGSLVRTPAPNSAAAPPSSHIPAPTAGERAVTEAGLLLEKGDPAGALVALDRISPQEPAYPFARQLRGRAEAALREPGRPR